jgi:hypothetical protein
MTDIAIKDLLSEVVSLPHLSLLHYLLSESEGKHIAHCLDLDLVATGRTCEEAAVNLDSLVKAHIELALATRQYANLATKAPQSFWDQFADGKPIELEPRTLHIQIPESVQIVPVSEGKLRILARAAHAA